MAQNTEDSRVSPPVRESGHPQWCGIGITAVAAASIYCDGLRRKAAPKAGTAFMYRQPDYATD